MLKTIGLIAACAALSIDPSPASADDGSWPCEVLLCLSNPGGATEFAECLPPIRKLATHMASFKPFPVCTAGGVSAARYTPPSRSGQSGLIEMLFADGSTKTYVINPIFARSDGGDRWHVELGRTADAREAVR